MKQAWQIPAAVGVTAVLTFAGVSVLQASANGPIRALGVSFQSHATPAPSAVVLGRPSGARAGAGVPDGAVYGADELLAQAIWHIPAAQSVDEAEAAAAPPLMPRRTLPPQVAGETGEPLAGGVPRAGDGPAPAGVAGESAELAAGGRGPGEGDGPGGPAPEAAPRAEAAAAAAEAPRLRAAAPGPGAAVVASQSGFTAWGTSRKWAEEALRTAASEAAQAVHVGKGKGVGPQGGPGEGGN